MLKAESNEVTSLCAELPITTGTARQRQNRVVLCREAAPSENLPLFSEAKAGAPAPGV
jgi:hypothetical protein